MMNLGSERVKEGDAIDSHLCRYDVPDLGHGVQTQEFVRVRWIGFITPALVKELFLDVWKSAFKGKRRPKRQRGSGEDGDVTMDGTLDGDELRKWFSMSAQAFGGRNAWSLMQFSDRETLFWEVER